MAQINILDTEIKIKKNQEVHLIVCNKKNGEVLFFPICINHIFTDKGIIAGIEKVRLDGALLPYNKSDFEDKKQLVVLFTKAYKEWLILQNI